MADISLSAREMLGYPRLGDMPVVMILDCYWLSFPQPLVLLSCWTMVKQWTVPPLPHINHYIDLDCLLPTQYFKMFHTYQVLCCSYPLHQHRCNTVTGHSSGSSPWLQRPGGLPSSWGLLGSPFADHSGDFAYLNKLSFKYANNRLFICFFIS